MKFGLAVCGAFVAGAALTLVAAAPWQDAKAKDKPAGAAAGPSQAEMEAWTKFGTPGPQHAEMAKLAGKWTVTGECTMAPGAPAQQSNGTAEFKTIFDGRYVVQEMSSVTPMGPMHGMGLMAYNNATGKYEDTWCDDMSTAIMYTTGVKSGDTIAYSGEMMDPVTKSMSKMRYDIKQSSPTEFSMEMYCTPSGKPEYKCMSLKYTKAAAGAR